jgi:hypothetical protein
VRDLRMERREERERERRWTRVSKQFANVLSRSSGTGCLVWKTSDRGWAERSIVEEYFRTGECPSWWGEFDFDIALGRRTVLENY